MNKHPKVLCVVAPNCHRFQLFLQLCDGAQWSSIICVGQAHELFGRSSLNTFILLLEDYNMHPEWDAIRAQIEKMGSL